MPLTAGARLGPYEIIGALGAGGPAVVRSESVRGRELWRGLAGAKQRTSPGPLRCTCSPTPVPARNITFPSTGEHSRSGPRLAGSLYRGRGAQQFFSATIRSLVSFQADPLRLLFEAKSNEYEDNTPVRNWSVSADGQRFLLQRNQQSTDKPVTEMHVVLNWAEELTARVPVK